MSKYDFNQVLNAIKYNSVEVIPNNQEALEKEIFNLVEQANIKGEDIKHYIGFEISGLIHIGTGIISAMKIKKLTEAGVICHIWLANFHTYLNNKLDGKLETINQVSNEYFKPCMIKCLETVGCDMTKVLILDSLEEYKKPKNDQGFWLYDLEVCKNLSLSRILKSISITGKKEGQEVEFGLLRYPSMQVADAYFLGTHLVHAGIDQRKCHVLMREVANKIQKQFQITINNQSIKPIAIHHSLLLSLNKPDENDLETSKMSKSKPDSAIFVHDSLEEIERKIKKAYCPAVNNNLSLEEKSKIQDYNPLLNWCQLIILQDERTITIEKLESTGQPKTYTNYKELREDYLNGDIFPTELKKAITITLSKWFYPIYQWSLDKTKIINLIENIKYKKNIY